MNNEIINIKLKNKIKIIETASRKYVEKTKKKDLTELFNFLENRNFTNFPKIIEEENNLIRYEYINSAFSLKEEKAKDLIRTLADLHYKTSYEKDVSKKKYKQIYEKLINNIDYLKDYYEKMITKIEHDEYPSPNDYLISRNYSIINGSLLYAEREINNWFRIVEKKDKERVSIVHNNIRTEHFIKGEENYIISWDEALVDTPILDLYKFYKREYNNYDFLTLLNIYNSKIGLTEEEKKLFLILISIPNKIENNNTELENVINTKNIIDYIYKTNKLITSGVFNVENNQTTN